MIIHFVYCYVMRNFKGIPSQLTIENSAITIGVLLLQVLQEYKFEFIRIVCSHEHYVQLSLPTLRSGYARTKGEPENQPYPLSVWGL